MNESDGGGMAAFEVVKIKSRQCDASNKAVMALMSDARG